MVSTFILQMQFEIEPRFLFLFRFRIFFLNRAVYWTDCALEQDHQNQEETEDMMVFWLIFMIFYLPLGVIFKLAKRYM